MLLDLIIEGRKKDKEGEGRWGRGHRVHFTLSREGPVLFPGARGRPALTREVRKAEKKKGNDSHQENNAWCAWNGGEGVALPGQEGRRRWWCCILVLVSMIINFSDVGIC